MAAVRGSLVVLAKGASSAVAPIITWLGFSFVAFGPWLELSQP